MTAHIMPRHFIKRQNTVTDPLPAPTGAGISNAITASTETATATKLAFDTKVPDSGATETAPNIAITSTPVITVSPSSAQALTTETPASSPSPSAVSNASAPIPMGTVIGSCVGAFIGAVALICLGLWFYRRYYRSLKKQAQSQRALRNAQNDTARRRSHLEPWNKLEEGDDKWEGVYQTKEVDNVAPMEKLTMFKKSPSVRTAWTHKSEEHPVAFDAQSFPQYHPGLASNKPDKKSAAPPVLALSDVSSSMTSSMDMAIPTPPAVPSQLHRWESAEVIHYDANQATEKTGEKISYDSGPVIERRKSLSNPFFNAQRHSTSTSHSRSSSKSTIVPTTKLNKGKERAVPLENPFGDDNSPPVQPAGSETHTSSNSQDRALQSLIAALEVSEAEIQERLRVASMQPSVFSSISAYTEDEDVTASFPLPPSAANSSLELR